MGASYLLSSSLVPVSFDVGLCAKHAPEARKNDASLSESGLRERLDKNLASIGRDTLARTSPLTRWFALLALVSARPPIWAERFFPRVFFRTAAVTVPRARSGRGSRTTERLTLDVPPLDSRCCRPGKMSASTLSYNRCASSELFRSHDLSLDEWASHEAVVRVALKPRTRRSAWMSFEERLRKTFAGQVSGDASFVLRSGRYRHADYEFRRAPLRWKST